MTLLQPPVPELWREVSLDLTECARGLLFRTGLHDSAVTAGCGPLLVTPDGANMETAHLPEELAESPRPHRLHEVSSTR